MFFKRLDRRRYQNAIPVVLPFVLFVVHSCLFRNWIIDDAGISFVYSRNFAFGHGFVSQPGMSPVEGFSNFTWVLLMSPFFLLEIFDPIATPKIVSLVLVLVSYAIIHKILIKISVYPIWGTWITLIFLSLNTSFVIWTVSGLENSLYTMIIVMILWKTIEYDADKREINQAITIGILSALCALSRPDGILYASIFPLFAAIDVLRKNNPKDAWMSIFLYVGSFMFIFGGYLIFRFFYFGDMAPNTYYAKGGEISLSLMEGLVKVIGLLGSVGIGKSMFICIGSLLVYLGLTKNMTRHLNILAFALWISLLNYVLLPFDWMPEFRFATPFFPLFYLFLYLVAEMFYEKSNLGRIANRLILVFLFLFLLTSSVPAFFLRSKSFAGSPTVPFTKIAALYGNRFDEYAKALGVRTGSILLPDVGATLYYSRLKVYDLAGLTDKVIARNLGRNQVFYDYILDTTKPTFIHTHGPWAYRSNFDADPRFRRDYVAIHETIDTWIFEQTGETIFSGDYVRKDVIKDPEAFITLQASLDKE